jgi:hypothetical protein
VLETVMRRSYAQLSPARRQQILDESRAAGRMGSREVPLAALLAVPNPSDTFIGSLYQAHATGKAQRTQDEYREWLTANFARLSDACADAGVDDGGKWLRQQYTIETGKTTVNEREQETQK